MLCLQHMKLTVKCVEKKQVVMSDSTDMYKTGNTLHLMFLLLQSVN